MPFRDFLATVLGATPKRSGNYDQGEREALPYKLTNRQQATQEEFRSAFRLATRQGKTLAGPGASSVLAAQAVIRAAARKAPPSGGIRAVIPSRPAKLERGDEKLVVTAPAIVTTAVQLNAPAIRGQSVSPAARALLATAEGARDNRKQIKQLADQIIKGQATPADLNRLKYMVRTALNMPQLPSDFSGSRSPSPLASTETRPDDVGDEPGEDQ